MIALAETLANGLIAAQDDARRSGHRISLEAEERLAALAESLARIDETARGTETRIDGLKAEIEVSDALNAEYAADNAELRTYVAHLEYNIAAIKRENADILRMMEEATAEPRDRTAAPSPALASIYADLVRHRETRIQRLLASLRRDALWEDVAPAFAPLKQYTGENVRRRGHRMVLSEDLRTLDHREYTMPMSLDALSRISVAVNPLAPSEGMVGIEVMTADRLVVARDLVPLSDISDQVPVVFNVPLGPVARHWRRRIFVQEATAPVTIYELYTPNAFRRRPLRRPFVSIE